MRLAPGLRLVAGGVALVFASGCDGGPAAPEEERLVSPRIVPLRRDATSAQILVTPTGGTFQLGKHAISIPAYTICNPRRSGYGPELWDAPCDPLRIPILVRVQLVDVDGWYVMSFAPQLRFVPTDNPDRYVRLYMHTEAAQLPDAEQSLRILYLVHPDAEPIDESIDDPTQRTFVDADRGYAFRRIKHFSLYSVMRGYMAGASIHAR